MEKEFEKHFSFRLNKFLNFSDICFSHHSALHTDPDKINTFHLVGETGPSGNRGLGRGKYFNIILCKHSFSSHSLKSPLVMSSAAGLRGQRGVWQITQLTHFSPPSSSAPSTGCVFSSHVFLAILKCFSSPHQARPVDSSQHFSVRLLLFVLVFVKIFCIQILTNISFNIFCTFWYRRTNNRQIGFMFCYPHSLRMSMNIFVSLAWWWELSSCHYHLWQGITAVTKWLLRRIDCSNCSCSLGRPPPPVSTDIWQCQGQGWSPWCWCQTWLMASLDQPRREECGERG